MAACAPMTSETPVAEEARAKKIKCPSYCPTSRWKFASSKSWAGWTLRV